MSVGAAALLFWPGGASAQLRELEPRIAQVQTTLKSLDDQLRLVEQGFVARLQSGSDESLDQRFGEAELAFLLTDYDKATSLLYDVVLSPSFRSHNRYFDGLYDLGESLKRQKDFLGAKHLLRQLMDSGPATPHFEEALVSYLEVAARTNDFRDLDRFTALAERSGRVAPAVEYLLAKATFERTDLAPSDRLARAQAMFAKVSAESPFYLQGLYFIGVCLVQAGQLPQAREAFAKVTRVPPAASSPAAEDNPPAAGEAKRGGLAPAAEAETVSAAGNFKEIRELAYLAIGRVDYELGNFNEALDAYQNIPENSGSFYDALYEIAWTYVKRGDFESARKAVELLTLGAPEGTLLPEASLLRGQLLLKLGRYDESVESYQQVVSKYGPVRDQIDQLLAINGDPAAYFDRLLAQKGGAFDVASLLPAPARGFANSQREVREAQAVARDLGDGRKGIDDADVIVARLNKRMRDAGNLSAFPALQAGNQRAGAVDTALLQQDTQLVNMEQAVLADVLSPGERAELSELARQRTALERRFADLPKSNSQVAGQQQQRLEQLKARERDIFKLSLVVQSLRAQGVAVQRLAEETRAQRRGEAADQARLGNELSGILELADNYDQQIGNMLLELRHEETVSAGGGDPNDQAVRTAYAAALQREADLLSGARNRAPAGAAAQAAELQALRDEVAQLRSRAGTASDQIRQAAVAQAEVIRQKIAIESGNLDSYRSEVQDAEGNAGGLVGRIAFESFRRVRRQVYDLVLKADVGIIDVAWTRKRDDAEKIQKLASDKDREVRTLDEDFHEVLEEVQ